MCHQDNTLSPALVIDAVSSPLRNSLARNAAPCRYTSTSSEAGDAAFPRGHRPGWRHDDKRVLGRPLHNASHPRCWPGRAPRARCAMGYRYPPATSGRVKFRPPFSGNPPISNEEKIEHREFPVFLFMVIPKQPFIAKHLVRFRSNLKAVISFKMFDTI